MDIGVYGARGIPSTYGGFETFLTALLPAFIERGHRVTMYCRRGTVPETGTFKGVRQHFAPALTGKSTATLSHGLTAACWARVHRHDVVLVVNCANAPFCRMQKLSGQRVVLNTDGQEWLREKWGRVARRYFMAAARASAASSSAVVTDSKAMRDVFADRFGIVSTVIPYAWTSLEYERDVKKLKEFDLERRGYYLAAGRFVPENGLEKIAESYLDTKNAEPLVILGGTNHRSSTTRRLVVLAEGDDRLRLLGHVNDRRVFALLVGESRAYIHGHSVGGINPALLEAMGLGASVLALDTPFNREALGECGEFFASFGKTLTCALGNTRAGSSGLGELAKGRVKSEFSMERVVEAYEALLAEVCGRPSRWTTVMDTHWGLGKHLVGVPDATCAQSKGEMS